MKRITQEEVRAACESLGHTNPILLSEKSRNGRVLIQFMCDLGVSHTQLWDSTRTGHGCGCKKVSYPENLIRQLLEWWTGLPCPKITRRALVAITLDNKDAPFEVDVYSRERRLGIEVDGDLHRKGWDGGRASAEAIITRDRKKDEYFERHQDSIGRLLRISTEELRGKSVDEVRILFSRKMEALDVPGPMTADFRYRGQLTKKASRLMEIRALASLKGVRLLDDQYLNNTSKHTFSCAKHGKFRLSPNYLLQNDFGCKACAKESAAHKLRLRSGALPLVEASNLAAEMKIPTYEVYVSMFRAGQLPNGLPGNPYVVYGKDPRWKGVKPFLKGQVI
jgi:hypothetical protein